MENKINRRIAILQPNYIPWKGVFDLINRVDIFVFFDDVQYTTKDWRNRNKIKTPNGDLWLTVPVKSKGQRHQLICEAEINTEDNWQLKHYKTIKSSYQKAKFFKEYEFLLEEIYLKTQWKKIADLDIFSTKLLASTLGIRVQWINSSNLNCSGDKEGERVVEICNKLNCNYFINGPSAKAFMSQSIFDDANITLDYINYNYPEYPQLYSPFNHYVSVLDLIFNCGNDAKKFI